MEAPIGRGAERKTGLVDVISDEPVRTWEVASVVGAGKFARGCGNAQLLVLPSIGLVMVWTIRPIGKNEVSEGLEIQLSFPCGTEDVVPVCLVEDSNSTAAATYTLVARDLGHID